MVDRQEPLLLSYYGDDFTGSTDVMEALASSGVETVLFLRIPDDALLKRFSDCRAIGLAGTSRSESPAWMEAQLRPAFAWLGDRHARVCHYKVCSTFDSSPSVGSIGRAIEIGRSVFDQGIVPMVVGAAQLKRYTAFGHLFAAYQGAVYRIDRHPVMSRHPVTPMTEADLTLHLSRQTSLPIALADLTGLNDETVDAQAETLSGAGILMLDVDSPVTQAAAGLQLARLAKSGARFMAGSSGLEYALLSAWREEGLVSGQAVFPPPGAVDRIAVVSGSVSPTTERQIRQATLHDGFKGIPLDPVAILGEGGEAILSEAIKVAREVLAAGQSVILHTALGPGADRGADIDRIAGSRHRLGRSLGRILLQLIESEGLRRVVIAGGDTSSHALSEMKIDALTTLLPLPQTPGSPLCTAHGLHAPTNGLQIALKGGQVGSDGYFAQILAGVATTG
jgi:uncharacterized protein YgbK (DUF1537 family)